ncbi:hypothetical protein CCHR01_00266 [Colletotrichum chrysophilum]|uniref:Uncharacterized protein n=1 Tax=Colletotrichum chrysophilum TaxID=1836956 RepID=A0AAD9ERH4_9PEZI|nr:hypothetical protein CCHR01_00266 [Colletotrichum chrysophilum]
MRISNSPSTIILERDVSCELDQKGPPPPHHSLNHAPDKGAHGKFSRRGVLLRRRGCRGGGTHYTTPAPRGGRKKGVAKTGQI